MLFRFFGGLVFYFLCIFRLFCKEEFPVTNLARGEDVTLAAYSPILIPSEFSITLNATDKSQAVNFTTFSSGWRQDLCYVEVSLFASDQSRVVYYKLRNDGVPIIYLLSSENPAVVSGKLKAIKDGKSCGEQKDVSVLVVTSDKPMQIKR